MKKFLLRLSALLFVTTVGLVGCSTSDTSESGEVAPSESITETENTDVSAEQLEFQQELVASGMTLEDASTLIEAAGYMWRVGSIDGQEQVVTMDYRIDRLTLSTQDNIVIDATWG
ncbi:MAG: hypothetical protein WAO33_00035 [Candidatus Nanopelagicales bacterium]